MRPASSSLAMRAFLALLLTIGFYGLALAIVAVLLFIPYAEIRFADRLHIRLAAACLVGAGTILWSILPRRDRFVPPGPRLIPKDQPDLFDNIKDVARKTEQRMPAEVYLIPDVNAFVAERGGFMGIGSRRVMGVGLALLQGLTVPQFRTVLAHEFGHFYGGDTKLSPWVYKTRQAIIRTVMGLRESSLLQAPFRGYAKLFLRITHALSRRQEFVADELAVRTEGSKPFVEGLRVTSGLALAFQAFWRNEVIPVLGAGYHPPLAEGFSLFIGASSIEQAMDKAVEKELERTDANPYDTHPSLRERIAAVQALPDGEGVDDDTPAISLLNGVPELERELLGRLYEERRVQKWKPLGWGDVGTTVYIPAWQETTGEYASVLSGVRVAALPEFVRSPDPLVSKLRGSVNRSLTKEEIAGGIVNVTGAALAVALVQAGWVVETAPGAAIVLKRNGEMINPFSVVSKLVENELTADAWRQRCEELAIAELILV